MNNTENKTKQERDIEGSACTSSGDAPRIIRENALFFKLLEEAKEENPVASFDKVENLALYEGLWNIESRLGMLSLYLESLSWFVSDAIEAAGSDASRELEHICLDVSHALDDAEAVKKDAESILGVTRARIMRQVTDA